jgi:hypothetical protein
MTPIFAARYAERRTAQQSGTGKSRSQSSSELQEAEGMLMGLVGQRRQLVAEMEELQERKVEIADKLTAASREQASIYRQAIAEMDQQLSGARTALRGIESAIAARQGVAVTPAPVTGVIVEHPRPPVMAFPESNPLPMYLGAGALTLVTLSIAMGMVYARRLRRDTAAAIERLQTDLHTVLQKLTHGVDAMAVEVERIGEGQRYVTKALVEKKEPI